MRARHMGSAVVALLLSWEAIAAVMTNKDVLTLLEAGMSEDVVIRAIQTSETKFDTSAAALVRLKNKGATPAILKAMMPQAKATGAVAPSPSAQPSPRASPGKAARAAGSLNPEEVLAVVDGSEAPMSYIVAGTRTAARALGFGGFATYAVLNGKAAQRRLPNTVDFIVSVPKSAQATNYATLASFAVRSNNSREVVIGGGFASYSTGIHPDRIIPISIDVLDDQSRAQDGFVLHRIRPANQLPSGEYALVLHTSEVKVVGFFPQAASSYFDFGVD